MIAPQPTEIVRRLFEAYAAGDVKTAVALITDDITAVSLADGRAYAGIDEVRAYLDGRSGAARRVELDAQRIWADGDDVLVHGRIRVLERGSLADSPATWRFVLRDGRVSRMEPAHPAASAA